MRAPAHAAALLVPTICVALASCALSVGSIAAPPATVADAALDIPAPHRDLELEVHSRVNRYRTDRGLKPLEYDTRVAEIARLHSIDMAAGRLPLGHDRFEERTAAVTRIHQIRSMAENVAYDNRPAVGAHVVVGWIGSPGHRRNIEGPYDLTGVGIARDPEGVYYFTQLFIARAP